MFQVEKIRLGAVNLETAEYLQDYGVPDAYGIYRTDTKNCLGVVGGQYVPIQNEVLHEVIKEAAAIAGLNHDEVLYKELQGGRKVAFQVKLPDWNMSQYDNIKRWASALNSHDGSSSLAMGLVGFRVLCKNTWVTAYKGCKRARHSVSIKDNVKIMSDELLGSIARDKEEYDRMVKFLHTPYHEDDHSKFIKELIGFDLDDLAIKEDREAAKGNLISTTKSENKFNLLSESIDIELQSAGNNYWGLFNGVTRFTNHIEAVRKEDPEYYLYFGSGRKMTDKALEILELS